MGPSFHQNRPEYLQAWLLYNSVIFCELTEQNRPLDSILSLLKTFGILQETNKSICEIFSKVLLPIQKYCVGEEAFAEFNSFFQCN